MFTINRNDPTYNDVIITHRTALSTVGTMTLYRWMHELTDSQRQAYAAGLCEPYIQPSSYLDALNMDCSRRKI